MEEIIAKIIKDYNLDSDKFIKTRLLAFEKSTYILYFENMHNVIRYILEIKPIMNNIDEIFDYYEFSKDFFKYAFINSYKGKIVEYLKTKDGMYYLVDNNKMYLLSNYVENSIFFDKIDNKGFVNEAASCLAMFHYSLAYFPEYKLETYQKIPLFSNFIEKYNKVILMETKYKDFIIKNKCVAFKLYYLYKENKLHLRVINDNLLPKNFLFDFDSNLYLCLKNILKMKPGLYNIEIAKAIINLCFNENEFNNELFECFINGYIHTMKLSLRKEELDSIVDGLIYVLYDNLLDSIINNQDYIYFNSLQKIIDMQLELEKLIDKIYQETRVFIKPQNGFLDVLKQKGIDVSFLKSK